MVVLHLVKTSVRAMWALRLMRELVAQGIEVQPPPPRGGPAGTSGPAPPRDAYTRPRAAPRRGEARARPLGGPGRPDIIHSHFVVTTLVMRLAPAPRPYSADLRGPRAASSRTPPHAPPGAAHGPGVRLLDSDLPLVLRTLSPQPGPARRLHLGYYGGEIARERSERGRAAARTGTWPRRPAGRHGGFHVSAQTPAGAASRPEGATRTSSTRWRCCAPVIRTCRGLHRRCMGRGRGGTNAGSAVTGPNTARR